MYNTESEFNVNSTGEPTIDREAVSEGALRWISESTYAKTSIREEIQRPTGRPLPIRLPKHLQEMLGVLNGEIGMLGNGSLVHWNQGLVIVEKERLYTCVGLPLPKENPQAEEMVTT